MKKYILGVFSSIAAILAVAISFRIGYCKAIDEKVDASECKPAYKWY